MTAQHYDYFVIGAGSGGVRSARIAAGYGAKVGVAEGSALGGTCVNLGCIPKKLLAYGADFGHAFEDARGYGWDVPEDIGFDWQALIANKNQEITRLNGIYEGLFDKVGVDFLKFCTADFYRRLAFACADRWGLVIELVILAAAIAKKASATKMGLT